MASTDEKPSPDERNLPDAISCVGLLLIGAVLLSTLGVSLGSSAVSRDRKDISVTASQMAISLDSVPTSVPALTASPTEELAETPTASQIPSPVPTETALPPPTSPPTETPRPTETITSENLLSATPTETPLPPLFPTPNGSYSWTLEVPILMYHYVSLPPEDADEYRLDLSVTPDNFRKQMAYLVDNGYSTVDLYDLSLAIVDKRELPPKPVVITLDDGYRDNYVNAFAILRELGLRATFFVVTDFIDQSNGDYLNWEMIEEMSSAGMRIEPHSKSHPDLTEHDRDFVIWQILGSTETLELHTGNRPRYFAYPAGRYNDDIIQIVDELGFWGAVVTEGGKWHGFNDRFEWTRLRMRNTTTLEEFADFVE